MPIYSELAALLDDVAGRVDRWTRQGTWEPEPGSPGAADLANTGTSRRLAVGERPTRTGVGDLVAFRARADRAPASAPSAAVAP
jgi:hypothetical protein